MSDVGSSSKTYHKRNILSNVAPSSKTYHSDINNIALHGMRKFPDLKQGNGTMKRFPSAIVIGVQKGGTGKSHNILSMLGWDPHLFSKVKQ